MVSKAEDKMRGLKCILEILFSVMSSIRYFVARCVFTGGE